MPPKIPVNLSTFTKPQIKSWLESFEVILTDCDGVLWLYNNIIKDSNKVINKFLEHGKKVYFITNNSTKTRDELVEKAKNLEFNVVIVSLTDYVKANEIKA